MNSYFLRQIREDKKISIKDAAKAVQEVVNNMYLVESGKRRLSEEKLTTLAAIYDCSRSWFTDTPGTFSPDDICFYLKKLYFLGKGQYEIHHQGRDVVIKFKNSEIIDDWHEVRTKYKAGEITLDQYNTWVYNQTGSGEHTKIYDKLQEIRRKRELEDPNVNNNLALSLGSLSYYMQIENGLVVPKKKERELIAQVLGYSEEFLFDQFGFFSPLDIKLFLLTIDSLFHVIQVGQEGLIKFDMPELNMFFEKISDLEIRFSEGKITKAQYDTEWIKL